MLNYIKISDIFVKDTGIKNLHLINKEILNKWKECLLTRVSHTSCNTYFRHIKALVKFAYDEGYIQSNPFIKFRNVAVYKTKFKCISSSDVNKLIIFLNASDNTLPPTRFWILTIKMFYYTGIRLRQFIGLTWADINLEKGIISLKAEYSKTKREWDVPIHPNLIDELKEFKNQTICACKKDDIEKHQAFNVTLFNQNYSGKNMSREQVSGFFRNLSKKSGIQVSTKRFRHRLATDLANNNENMKVVQKLLGHANISTTAGYIHVNINDLQRVLKSTTTI
jgi:site-specific recombinase XerD